MTKNNNLIKIICLLAVFGCSFSSIFSRMITASGMITAMYRMVFTVILLTPYVLCRCKEELSQVSRRSLIMCAVSGIFLGFHFNFYLSAANFTTISSCTVLVDTETFFVALALIFLFREKIPAKGICGILLAFAGAVIIALTDTGSGTDILKGDFFALIGAMSISIYTLIGRDQRKYLTTTVYTFIVYTFSAITLVVASLITGQQFAGYPSSDYLMIFGMTILCTFLGHSILNWAVKYVSAAFISTSRLCDPVYASLRAIFLFD
ncbi:MAG: DMT family transporter [Clostridiales bacterium]|nr:DMT family transporter [Clostridiales bacterium]